MKKSMLFLSFLCAFSLASADAPKSDYVGDEAATDWIGTIIAVLLLAGFVLGLAQMLGERNNDRRIFVGSYARLICFGLMMLSGVFFLDKTWEQVLQILGATLTVAFSYLAYLKPADKIVRDGMPRKNLMQIIGGMWVKLENRRVNRAYIKLKEQAIQRLNEQMPRLSEAEQTEANHQIDALNRDIYQEKYKMGETVMLLIISVVVGVIFIWLTPFVALLHYVKNYPLYLRKRKSAAKSARV